MAERAMPVDYVAVDMPRDQEALVAFLCRERWPFHAHEELAPPEVLAMDFASDDVESFWICVNDRNVGLVRIFDLGDSAAGGAPLFDLRLAAEHRGLGLGTHTVRWLTHHLFTNHATLHRVEATTRHDNTAMQRALAKAGYRQEGRLREAWPSSAGERFDTMLYAILRSDWLALCDA